MPASRQSQSKERYAKLLEESLSIVQARDFSVEELAQTAEDSFTRVPGAVLVPIERIDPNPDNPRQVMNDAALEDLAASVAERGLLQPLVVRRNPDQIGSYVVIAGSRRLLASRLVHGNPDEAVRERVAVLPCIIREISQRDAFADALLENLARADLSRAETMDALLRLNTEYGWSGKTIAKRTGRSQGDVSELLSIATDVDLGALVRTEVVKPSAATIIRRMVPAARQETIDDLKAGKKLTVDEVRYRYQSTRGPRKPASSEGASNTTAVVRTDEPSAQGVSNSIPPRINVTEPGPLSHDAQHGRVGTTEHTNAPHNDTIEGSRAAAVPGLLDRILAQTDEIDAIARMVDVGTTHGQVLLSSVQRDLAATYEKLVLYLQRHDEPGV